VCPSPAHGGRDKGTRGGAPAQEKAKADARIASLEQQVDHHRVQIAALTENSRLHSDVSGLVSRFDEFVRRQTEKDDQLKEVLVANSRLHSDVMALVSRFDTYLQLQVRKESAPNRRTLEQRERVKNPKWDPAEKDPNLVLSNGNRTVSTSSAFNQSVMGTIGFTTGIHRWAIRIDQYHDFAIGVHPKPRVGGTDFKSCYGVNDNGSSGHGPANGGWKHEAGIHFNAGDVANLVLDCDAHTLTISNPRGETATITNRPSKTTFYPFAFMTANAEKTTSLTLIW